MSGTQLHKVLTHTKGGHRLGTSSATWNKIKQAATETRGKSNEGADSGVSDASKIPENLSQSTPPSLVEGGPNGEVCIWYQNEKVYEIWGWDNVASYALHREEGEFQNKDFYSATTADPGTYNGDTLSLLSRFEAPDRSVQAMAFMTTESGMMFLSAYSSNGGMFLEARATDRVQELSLPKCFQGDTVQLKASSKYLIISSAKGLLYILKYSGDPDSEALLVNTNCDGSLQSVYSHSTRALVEKHQITDLPKTSILLKTGIFDGAAIYDLVGTWLVYCPKRVETEYFKNLMHSTEDSCTESKNSKARGTDIYTPVKLPPGGPILLRAAASLANSAIDNILKLSQIGSKKVKAYWKPDKTLFEKDISLQTLSASIGHALSSTASKIKKQADLIGENEIVKIIDLSNGQIMATFKPPGGISHLSLSEYDLQLAQATYRGDNFYIWDLCKLPSEVSFVGKFLRGKTSAIIKEVFWFVNNKTLGDSQITNSGFGCITKKTGSVHWYNINYLFCANENDNYPNTMELSPQVGPRNSQFLDSWVLPSIKAIKLLKVPGFSNVPEDWRHGGSTTNSLSSLRRCNQLAFVDSAFNLRLVSPLSGKHTFKYKLNEAPVNEIGYTDGPSYSTWHPFSSCGLNSRPDSQVFDTPLSQTEIETCAPFSSITKDRNVVLSSYKIGTEGKIQSFWDNFAIFGNDVPCAAHEFIGCGENEASGNSSDNLAGDMDEGLLISLGIEES